MTGIWLNYGRLVVYILNDEFIGNKNVNFSSVSAELLYKNEKSFFAPNR